MPKSDVLKRARALVNEYTPTVARSEIDVYRSVIFELLKYIDDLEDTIDLPPGPMTLDRRR